MSSPPSFCRFLETFEYNHESLQSDEKLHYMTLLSSLLNSTEEMMTLHNRLKMSGFERDLGLFVISHRNLLHNDDSVCGKLRPFKDLIVDTKSKQDHARDWACETLKFRREPELARELKTWDIPKFPVTGHHLKDAGCPPGKLMSVVLTELRSAWKKSDFQMSPEELMDKLSDIVKNLDMSKVPSKSKKQRKNSS